jgi:hypothetical protein
MVINPICVDTFCSMCKEIRFCDKPEKKEGNVGKKSQAITVTLSVTMID